MSISKKLVETKSGNLELISKLNEGSEFLFILKFQICEKNNSSEKNNKFFLNTNYADKDPFFSDYTNSRKNTKNCDSKIKENKINALLCEDTLFNVKLIKNLTDGIGINLHTAENGKIGLEKLKEKKFDVIFMDLQMPTMDRFETTEYIRGNISSNIPIIAMTANNCEIEKQKCFEYGMNEYLTKPFKSDHFYSILSKYFKNYNKLKNLKENKIPQNLPNETKRFKIYKDSLNKLLDFKEHNFSKFSSKPKLKNLENSKYKININKCDKISENCETKENKNFSKIKKNFLNILKNDNKKNKIIVYKRFHFEDSEKNMNMGNMSKKNQENKNVLIKKFIFNNQNKLNYSNRLYKSNISSSCGTPKINFSLINNPIKINRNLNFSLNKSTDMINNITSDTSNSKNTNNTSNNSYYFLRNNNEISRNNSKSFNEIQNTETKIKKNSCFFYENLKKNKKYSENLNIKSPLNFLSGGKKEDIIKYNSEKLIIGKDFEKSIKLLEIKKYTKEKLIEFLGDDDEWLLNFESLK